MTSQSESIILEPNELFIVSEFYYEGELKGRGIIKHIDEHEYQIVLHNNIHKPEGMEKYMIQVYTIDSLKNTFVLFKPYGYNYCTNWSFGLYLYNGKEPLKMNSKDMHEMYPLIEEMVDLTYFNHDFHKYNLNTILNYINSQPQITKIT